MADDLITWLRAQLDEDDRVARRVEPNQAPVDLRAMVTREGSAPFLIIDSARVLAEIDAKRRILDLHPPQQSNGRSYCDCMAEDGVIYGEWPCLTVRLLALPYAGREGYREEWCR